MTDTPPNAPNSPATLPGVAGIACSAWLGCVGLRKPVASMKPIGVYLDRYNGGKVHLLAKGDDWVIVQWPWKGHIRKQRKAYFESARFKLITA